MGNFLKDLWEKLTGRSQTTKQQEEDKELDALVMEASSFARTAAAVLGEEPATEELQTKQEESKEESEEDRKKREEEEKRREYNRSLGILKNADFDTIKKLAEAGELKGLSNLRSVSPEMVGMKDGQIMWDNKYTKCRVFLTPLAEFAMFASKRNQRSKAPERAKILQYLASKGYDYAGRIESEKYKWKEAPFYIGYLARGGFGGRSAPHVLSAPISKAILNGCYEHDRLHRLNVIENNYLKKMVTKKEYYALGFNDPTQKFSLNKLSRVSPKTIEWVLYWMAHNRDESIERYQMCNYEEEMTSCYALMYDLLTCRHKDPQFKQVHDERKEWLISQGRGHSR